LTVTFIFAGGEKKLQPKGCHQIKELLFGKKNVYFTSDYRNSTDLLTLLYIYGIFRVFQHMAGGWITTHKNTTFVD
jgi:hypothetical protein